MTDQELRDLVAETSRAVRNLSERDAERSKQEVERWEREAEHWERSRQEMSELRQALQAQAQTQSRNLDRLEQALQAQAQTQSRNLDRLEQALQAQAQTQSRNLDRLEQTLQAHIRYSNKVLDRQDRQIGGLGNKFGSYTEGLAWSSIESLLRDEFGADKTEYNVSRRLAADNDQMEVDALGWNHNKVYVVEVKSYLHSDELKQVMRLLGKFPQLFPEHATRKAYGVIVAVDLAEGMAEAVAKKGLYLARARGDLFKLESPPGFSPKVFGRNGRGDVNGAPKGKSKNGRRR